MPITAEQFTVEYFDKLVRGLSVARDAFALLAEEGDEQQERVGGLLQEVARLQSDLQEKPTHEELNELLEVITDVERGLRQPGELYAYVREKWDV